MHQESTVHGHIRWQPTTSALGLALILSLAGDVSPGSAQPAEQARPPSNSPLTLETVFARIDSSHPLLQGASAERLVARGKLLQALGAFEPSVVNDLELERFIRSGQTNTQTAGFNDTYLEARHPSGVRALAGIRSAINDATIPDLGFNQDRQQVLLGASVPLLRGLLTNPDSAALGRAELAMPRAEVEIARTRQDLFLAAASQYWEWVAASHLVQVRKRALNVSKTRLAQIRERAEAGAAAPLDIVEADQEVQSRTEHLIATRRSLEQASYKMSMFLWEDGLPVRPEVGEHPPFPVRPPVPPPEAVELDRARAREARPEVRAIMLEADINKIDLSLASNNLLPSLDAEAEPARSPEKFVLGLGYRFGVTLRFPFFQRQARGEMTAARAQANRLALALRYHQQKVNVDVDDAQSAMMRANERIAAAAEALRLARQLERGERFRFEVGATSVLFVNLRERNAVDAEVHWIHAQADYLRAHALYQWATGVWAEGSVVRTYTNP